MKFVLLLSAALVYALPTLMAQDVTSSVMLSGTWLPDNSHQLDFQSLPVVPSSHVMISDVRTAGANPTAVNKKSGGVNQHNYLAYFDRKFWAMWSDGPGVEDRVGQRVKYATSQDGIQWSAPEYLTPIVTGSGPDSQYFNSRTEKGFRWIARGFWIRDGELLALAALDEAAGFFGKSLQLHAFRFENADGYWHDAGVIYQNAINNFPPARLHTGDWMMSRRTHDYSVTGVHFLIGGTQGLNDWQSVPVFDSAAELKAEEPEWWILHNNSLAAVFRDNRRSGYLYRAFSKDDGRTWSKPVKTNFPDATSKVCGQRLRDGRYILISNPNPKKRDPLTLSVSDDGIVFTKMFYLMGNRHVDYPHVLEHEGMLYVAFSGAKQTVELLKIRLADLDKIEMPNSVLVTSPKS